MIKIYFKPVSVSCLVVASLLLSCSGEKEIIKYDPIEKGKYSAREIPASVGNNDEAYYIKNGFTKIGGLSVKLQVTVCFEKCEIVNQKYDSTTLLLKEAAEKGGDLVVIIQDKVRVTEMIRKNGKCIRSHQVAERVPPIKLLLVNPMHDDAEIVYKDVCDEYEVIRGTQEFHVSSGSVWRKISALR